MSSDTSMGTTDRRIKRLGRRISKLQDKLRPLSAAAAFLAVCILVLVPATILSGRFLVFWKPLTLVLLATQFAVAAEFYLAARNWRRLERRSFWESFVAVCLNPLSAIRSADTHEVELFSYQHFNNHRGRQRPIDDSRCSPYRVQPSSASTSLTR